MAIAFALARLAINYFGHAHAQMYACKIKRNICFDEWSLLSLFRRWKKCLCVIFGCQNNANETTVDSDWSMALTWSKSHERNNFQAVETTRNRDDRSKREEKSSCELWDKWVCEKSKRNQKWDRSKWMK